MTYENERSFTLNIKMKNLINSLALGKVLKKYNDTMHNKQQVILLSKRETTSWSAIHRLAKNIEFKQSVVDQQQNQLQQNNDG